MLQDSHHYDCHKQEIKSVYVLALLLDLNLFGMNVMFDLFGASVILIHVVSLFLLFVMALQY